MSSKAVKIHTKFPKMKSPEVSSVVTLLCRFRAGKNPGNILGTLCRGEPGGSKGYTESESEEVLKKAKINILKFFQGRLMGVCWKILGVAREF